MWVLPDPCLRNEGQKNESSQDLIRHPKSASKSPSPQFRSSLKRISPLAPRAPSASDDEDSSGKGPKELRQA